MNEATTLKADGGTVASKLVMPVYCKRLQINRSHHHAFSPASGNQVRDRILETAGRSHSDRTLDAHFEAMSSVAQ
jgi:hypothetical protein